METSHTNLVIRYPSQPIGNRLKDFFGLPKSIAGEFIDHEQDSWCMSDHYRCILWMIFVPSSFRYTAMCHCLSRRCGELSMYYPQSHTGLSTDLSMVF